MNSAPQPSQKELRLQGGRGEGGMSRGEERERKERGLDDTATMKQFLDPPLEADIALYE